jgi:hypothetical protein
LGIKGKSVWGERLGTVAHTCKLIYLGGGDEEDLGLRPSREKVSKIPISTNKLGMVACGPLIPVM